MSVRMRKTSARTNGWLSLFPKQARLIRTGQICKILGYYGKLFTLRLPDGSMAEFHLRDLDLQLPAHVKP